MVSDSAIFKITSKNEGTDPVVIALSRGIVTVGELAWAVNGSPAPSRIRLHGSQNILGLEKGLSRTFG